MSSVSFFSDAMDGKSLYKSASFMYSVSPLIGMKLNLVLHQYGKWFDYSWEKKWSYQTFLQFLKYFELIDFSEITTAVSALLQL